ncbi:hypothetical protein [Janthinobacterium tructae]
MLDIDLEYYDKNHEAQLDQGTYKTLKTADRVSKFRKTGKISKADFFNYFLIHRARNPMYKDYHQRIAYIGLAAEWVDGLLDTTTTIKSLPGCEGLQENIGEAVCLSVAGVMFELTAADWEIIPIQGGKKGHKTFDFERMMIGITSKSEIIQLEAKGSFVPDNTKKHQTVSKHSSSITKKKKNILANAATYKHPATARYGMIAAVDATRKAKCWLLDPPADNFEGDARKFKAANRLSYIADVVSLLAPKANLPDEIRLRAEQWRDSERTTLPDPIGRPYTVNTYVETFLARGKIWLSKYDIVGQLYVGKEGTIFFIGLLGEVIRDAIDGDLDVITTSYHEASSLRVTLSSIPFDIANQKKAESLDVSLNLHITSSGTVIGFVGD